MSATTSKKDAMGMQAVVDKVWDGADETWQWLRGVILGEWEDNRSLSQIVTDALAGFIPGVGSLVTLRDLLAVIVRLARHPEKREDVEEWILLVAMLLPLIITLAGAVVAGVGALVGAELGGFLRALTLCLVKKQGVALRALVEFFQGHGYGDVVKALRQVRFTAYKDALLKGLNQQINKLVTTVRGVEARLKVLSPESLPSWMPGRPSLIRALHSCPELIDKLEALRRKAHDMIPKALIELDQRLEALLAGNIKGVAQVTHSVAAGQAAPEAARLQGPRGAPVLKNPHPPEPGNTRRVPERRLMRLEGKREYKWVDEAGRPVGAKPYAPGQTKMEHPPLRREHWEAYEGKVREGWPSLAAEYAPGRFSTEYDTFSGSLRAQALPADSKSVFARLVTHDEGQKMDRGAFWNRELPADGADMRANSAIKEGWNKDGEYVELHVPPKGHPVWKELQALQEKVAGASVPFKEELKFWEGPAASQAYKKEVDGRMVDDEWYLPGGKPQQFFDRAQMEALQNHGFITSRKKTNFRDFDPVVGNIVPVGGPCFEVVPLDHAVPHAQPEKR